MPDTGEGIGSGVIEKIHVYFPVLEIDTSLETQKSEDIPTGKKRVLWVDEDGS